MNIRWNIILGTIALVLLAWFYTLNQDKPDLTRLIKAPESPEYTGHKMETTIFSPAGKKQYQAYSDTARHYDQDGHTEFVNPVVFALEVETENQGKQSWKLTAKSATLTKDNLLYLNGEVVAQSLDPISRLQRIETEAAVVNLKNQDITSDNMVTIRGLNFTSSGMKLTGNLKQQAATLKEQVKTHYEISNQ
ncbi:LPS export ABC transporter periplasmic protein LptC [Basfia succiniciproducens]|uniref:Lipopolysaccharide export system protein LptC n=1 Tax=Basfia succiniciproducens TaxID=653940 RepID=A0A1G5CEU2_9PAST|nr:LPS export ABC transporter periplasmic protein LptC [Basfia succiniciproducens]QIM68951.1 LPS export ABC transporter periplasmic protein LptC [Basfia succiniciproducens]SCY00824.1 lipopolysaccharide export system protein LptC [Basfia succiniciproducens]